MLCPFDNPPFFPWMQTNPLLTRAKKDSHNRKVIMDLSWPLPPRGQHKWRDSQRFLPGDTKKNAFAIRQAGKGCYMYATDVARAYRHLPLDAADWPLICFLFEGRYYIDISLPFGLR